MVNLSQTKDIWHHFCREQKLVCVPLTCRVKLVFEGHGGFVMFRFPVHRVLIENVRGPGETKSQVRNNKTISLYEVL